MPVYIYSCPNGHEVEFYKHTKTEKEPKRCPECRKKLEKIQGVTNWSFRAKVNSKK